MTTPSSQFHSQLLLLLPVILLVILGAAAEEQRPDCPDKCGDISIPFPFGIGPGCFHDGFEVLCNHSSDPPRAFHADSILEVESTISKSELEWWSSPLELVSISVATSEAVAYAPVAYNCSTNETAFFYTAQEMDFRGTPFAVSLTSNVLIGIGYRAEPELTYDDATAPEISCLAYDTSISTATNGSCGRGCCERTLPPDPDVGPSKYFLLQVDQPKADLYYRNWTTNPFSYSMLVEKYWYNFSTPDLYGDMTLLKRFPQGVPLALDFAAGNASCPAEGQPLIEVYPCSSGICRNKLGGYDCPCKFGMKGDGKAGTCTPVFTPAAKATVGAIGGILLMAVLSFLIILHKEKKKTKEFYKKNGGPTLEKANAINFSERGSSSQF